MKSYTLRNVTCVKLLEKSRLIPATRNTPNSEGIVIQQASFAQYTLSYMFNKRTKRQFLVTFKYEVTVEFMSPVQKGVFVLEPGIYFLM